MASSKKAVSAKSVSKSAKRKISPAVSSRQRAAALKAWRTMTSKGGVYFAKGVTPHNGKTPYAN